ncbi:U6 small nuclear RNA (adenine-(43)-N(6))-methyltransferase [Merluccius polli]|uniref:U6 small nuclear RNA (adenine-(43)-N(6))-methyltransferase n=1 Tax=Merluccius polli TaxID=89951 RepID=A0AA47NMF5_MERPO|nr:U6 small nuclear RNA (adenine-(43)-N(6))-methyltransferase [Merluccius polli]
MALNKSMHPRNRYKDKPPDFAYLASKYPDFRQHVHTSIAGRSICSISRQLFPDNYLFEWYRFTSQSIIYIHNLIRPYMCNITNRSHALTSQQILCVALRFFANRSFLYNKCRAVCRAVRKVCLAMKRLLPMLNFKEPEAVRELTCTLLKEDFGLTIAIPLERLIPTVPLRLNYIHWVEDLIDGQGQPRKGIDIGTGASCIYPLLGATMNGWYFLATEVDDICFDYATKNVPQKTLLMDALKAETTILYDFCMCNPPFFANQLEAKGENSRNSRRPPPSSVNTGGVTEIMAEGGELEFVKRIIHDSLQLKTRLRWYSCMLGKKCSLAPLKEELRKQGVPKVTHTEFCQGRTMRWALAWSFYDDVIVPVSWRGIRKLVIPSSSPRRPAWRLLVQVFSGHGRAPIEVDVNWRSVRSYQ